MEQTKRQKFISDLDTLCSDYQDGTVDTLMETIQILRMAVDTGMKVLNESAKEVH